MRNLVISACALVLVGCAPAEQTPAVDSPAAAPAALSLADLAGKWTQQVMSETSDSVLVTSELNVTADGATIVLPGRPPQPVTMTVDGDSMMSKSGPYESVLRAGVMVTVDGVARLVDGKLVGTSIARYATTGADSVVRLRTVTTRSP